jgi:hypothetical protein
MDKSFQDLGVNTLIKITGEQKQVFLFRAEKTADGIKGVLVSINNDSSRAYMVTLDPKGKILTQAKDCGLPVE